MKKEDDQDKAEGPSQKVPECICGYIAFGGEQDLAEHIVSLGRVDTKDHAQK